MSPNNTNQLNGMMHRHHQHQQPTDDDVDIDSQQQNHESVTVVKEERKHSRKKKHIVNGGDEDDTDETTTEEGEVDELTQEMERKAQELLQEMGVEGKNGGSQEVDDDEDRLPTWQDNFLFLAPSQHGTGWGVYAARDFQKGDIIEVAPLFLRFGEEDRVLKETILDHYHYEYWKWNGYGHDANTVLSFGYSLFYNHGDKPNIKYAKWGEEPTIEDPSSSVCVGYYAKRNIKIGEELLCTYGGESWFTQRGMIMVDPTSKDGRRNESEIKKKNDKENGSKKNKKTLVPSSQILNDDSESSTSYSEEEDDDADADDPQHHGQSSSSTTTPKCAIPLDDEEWKELYTSKIYTGHGKKKFKEVMKSITEAKSERKYNVKPYYKTRVAPFNAGYRNARAKVSIAKEGITMEIVPALIISKKIVRKTLLEPIVLQWKDIEPSSFDPSFHSLETLRVLYKRESTCWLPQYEDKGIENTCIVPLAGSLALMERTTSDDPNDYNCRLEDIKLDEFNENAFCVRIVSTRPIKVGEQLILKMSNISASKKRHNLIWMELLETGQPVPTKTTTETTDSGNHVVVVQEEEEVLDIDIDEVVRTSIVDNDNQRQAADDDNDDEEDEGQ